MPSFTPESDLLAKHLAEVRENVPFAHMLSLPSLDSLINGHLGRTVTVISGGPGTGKTTLANQMADELAAQGIPVLFVEREIAPSQLLVKSLSRLSRGRLSVADIPGLTTESEDFNEALGLYRESMAPRIASDASATTPVEIGALVSDCKAKTERTPVVFVDYVQILDGDKSKVYHEERLAIRDTMLGLRAVANTYDAHVVGISTVNRTSYAKASVDLSALGGCSFIEYSADVCLHLSVDGRGEEQAANLANPIRPVTITALKNRHGQIGSVPLVFDTAHATFFER